MCKHSDNSNPSLVVGALMNQHISFFPHQADVWFYGLKTAVTHSILFFIICFSICVKHQKGLMKHPKEVYRSLASEMMCDILLAFWQTATTSNSSEPLSADCFSLLWITKVASQTVISQVVQWIDAGHTAFVEKYYVEPKQIALNMSCKNHVVFLPCCYYL